MLDAVLSSKVCKGKCGLDLPLDAFGVHPLGRFGRKSKCKACLAEIGRQTWAPTEEQQEAARQRAKAWNAANPERKNEASKAWAKENPEKHNSIVRRWRKKNPERNQATNRASWERNKKSAQASAKRWRLEHPEAYREAQRRWRIENADYWRGRAEVIARGDLTWEQWAEVIEQFQHACAYCLRTDVKLSMDHLIPVSRGGPHTQSNVVPACKSCNSRKKDRPIWVMFEQFHPQMEMSYGEAQ